MFGAKECAGEIHVQHSLPLRRIDRDYWSSRSDDTSVVDQDIDASKLIDGSGYERSHGCFVGDVGELNQRLAARGGNFARYFVQGRFSAARQRHRAALARKEQGGFPPYSFAASSN